MSSLLKPNSSPLTIAENKYCVSTSLIHFFLWLIIRPLYLNYTQKYTEVVAVVIVVKYQAYLFSLLISWRFIFPLSHPSGFLSICVLSIHQESRSGDNCYPSQTTASAQHALLHWALLFIAQHFQVFNLFHWWVQPQCELNLHMVREKPLL